MVPLSYYLVLSGILFACGVTGFILAADDAPSIELFAAEVMPHLRRELDRPGAAAAAASVA